MMSPKFLSLQRMCSNTASTKKINHMFNFEMPNKIRVQVQSKPNKKRWPRHMIANLKADYIYTLYTYSHTYPIT